VDTNIRRTLAALGIAAVAASAAPMLPAWLSADNGGKGVLAPARAVPAQTVVVAASPALRSGVDGDGNGRGIWAVSSAHYAAPDQQIVVDLADGASAADIADIERRTGLDLRFNSDFAAYTDKVMLANVPAGREASVLGALRSDPRVEVAEEQAIYSIPEATPMPAPALTVYQEQAAYPGESLDAARAQAAAAMADEEARGVSFQTMLPQDGSTADPAGFSNAPAGVSLSTPSVAGYRALSGTRPNDPRYDEQWNFKMVDAEGAWKRTRGKGVVVAVIDTGVAAKTTKRGKQARDFNTTQFTEGYDFVHDDKDPYDDNGHGTHVAGTIAESTNNNEGVAGLAYEATIMPLKVLTAQGYGTSSDIADAIRYAADHGADVINMSLGSSQPSDVIRKACQYARKKNVTIVCAAGNGFGEPVGYPAAFPECIAISSVGPSGKIATYSSYGKQVALAAPGGDMMESGNERDGILQNTVVGSKGGDNYFAFQGTSMASPHAAAVAALVVAEGVKDPARVREVLTKTATPNGDANKYGAGILSASGAVARAAAETGPKLRHLLFVGLGLLMLAAGGAPRRRNLPLRAGMALALGVGFFAPDWWANFVGADSAWNLLASSALVPLAAYALLRRGPGVKVAGALALGFAVNLFANWHNGTLPFTTWTFGATAVPFTAANLVAAFGLANLAAWRAARNMR
jgi:serine protease